MSDSRIRGSARAPRQTVVDNGVVIATSSHVNGIVISRIVEQIGFKPLHKTPETAIAYLQHNVPSVIIFDGGADNRECREALEFVLDGTDEAEGPALIFLSTPHIGLDDENARGCHAIVNKPITSDALHPVILSLTSK